MLLGNVGKAAGDIGPARKNDALNLGADRRQRRSSAIAAVEKDRELGLGDRRACRLHESCKPARTDIAAGVGRAGEDDRPPDPGRGG